MSRHRRRSGLTFWIGTFLVGLLSTERGKRRIGREMAELQAENDSRGRRISELEYVNNSLVDQLAKAMAELRSPTHDPSRITTGEAPGDTDSETTARLPLPPSAPVPAECDNSELTSAAPDVESCTDTSKAR